MELVLYLLVVYREGNALQYGSVVDKFDLMRRVAGNNVSCAT